jgi:ectoine hydroxylase-related dioxygenase (phytanoyl-CoA dioxygenase family)
MQAIGNAGDAVVSHGLLWHRTAINHADKPRVAILINYTQLAVRPLTQLGPFDDEFIANASEPLKALLAVDMQKALGRRLRAHAQQT